MVDQEQSVVRNSKAREIQPRPNQAQTTTAIMTLGTALHPVMQICRNNNDGQPQQNKTSRAELQCFNCRDMEHFAKQC